MAKKVDVLRVKLKVEDPRGLVTKRLAPASKSPQSGLIVQILRHKLIVKYQSQA